MKKQSQVKIEVLNQRKNSEDDFADKVAEEKQNYPDKGEETESVKSKVDETNEKTEASNNLFAGMMNVDNVLADKAKKKEEKKKLVAEMNKRR